MKLGNARNHPIRSSGYRGCTRHISLTTLTNDGVRRCRGLGGNTTLFGFGADTVGKKAQKRGGFILGMVCLFIYIYTHTIHQVLRKSNNNRDSCGFQISKQNSNQETVRLICLKIWNSVESPTEMFDFSRKARCFKECWCRHPNSMGTIIDSLKSQECWYRDNVSAVETTSVYINTYIYIYYKTTNGTAAVCF